MVTESGVFAILAVALVGGPALSAQLPYELRDTVVWSNGMYGGESAVLFVGGAPVDTVDLLAGVQPVRDGLVYQPVRRQALRWVECDENEVCTDLAPWVVRTVDRVQPLDGLVPGFDPLLSSPLVIGARLFYVGFEPTGTVYRLFARFHDLEGGESGAVYLAHDSMETDNPGHVPRPTRVGDCVRFIAGGRSFLLDSGLEECGPGR